MINKKVMYKLISRKCISNDDKMLIEFYKARKLSLALRRMTAVNKNLSLTESMG